MLHAWSNLFSWSNLSLPLGGTTLKEYVQAFHVDPPGILGGGLGSYVVGLS